MELQAQLKSLLAKSREPLSIHDILESVDVSERGFLSEEDIRDILEKDYLFAPVDDEHYILSARLFSNVELFALADVEDIGTGTVFFSGGEAKEMFRPALARGEGVFFGQGGTFAKPCSLDSTGSIVFQNFSEWFKEVDFHFDQEVVLVRIRDYEQAEYSIETLDMEKLDALMTGGKVSRLCDTVAAFFENLVTDAAEGLETLYVLSYLILNAGFDFTAFPANISFYLSSDIRFLVSDDRVFMRESVSEDFTEYYFGKDTGLMIREEDVGLLDKGLRYLFEEERIKEAQVILKELKLKYPDERILNRFLYQAAYFQDNDEEFFLYAEKTVEDFPRDPDPWRMMGEVHLQLHRYEDADLCFQEAESRVHPDDTATLLDILSLWMFLKTELGYTDSAKEMARRILAIDETNEEALFILEATGTPQLRVEPPNNADNVIKVDFNNRKQD